MSRAVSQLRSVTSGLRRPSPLACAVRPRGCFRRECCTGDESTAAPRLNCFTTHERRIRGWTGRKNRFQVWVRPRQESNPNPAYQLCWRVHKQLCQQFTRCAERAPAQIAVFVISICEKAMLVYVVSLFLTKIGSIIWSNQLRGPVCDINEYFY